MTHQENPSHLRLVVARPRTPNGADAVSKGRNLPEGQLAFPFPEASAVFFVFVDSIGSNEFAQIVGDYTPRWIFDVRTVPRLDTIAASRISAFKLFEKSKINYVDLFGRLGIKSYRSVESNPALWASAVFDLLEKSERKGPYLFLFDDEQMMRCADNVLPEIMEPVVGKSASFARIRHTMVHA